MKAKSGQQGDLSNVLPSDALPSGREATVDESATWDLRTLGAQGRGERRRDGTSAAATRAGDYLLDGVIAEGGFGVVHRARHAETGAPAAVKVLHADLVDRPDVIARFEREIEAIQRIRHPSVVEIFGVGRLADGRPYFAMELLQGRSLEEHLTARGGLPPDEALAILEPLCAALSAAHARGIVHRDIKPSNILLCRQDAALRVVLLDFGIAKLLDTTDVALTSSRHVLGTPAFMSPEQLLGRPVDARTDVYALGALLFTLLVGTPPFTASAYALLRHQHLYQAPPRASAHAPVAAEFDDIVARAMSKDPAHRHVDVGAFLNDVRAAVARVLQPGAGGAQRTGRWSIGVLVEVLAEATALEAPTDSFLVDFETVLPVAIRELMALGFDPVVPTGNSMLFARAAPEDARGAEEARRAVIVAATSLHERLAALVQSGARVGVRLCVHAGDVITASDGSVLGGDLVELSSWLPEPVNPGVFASPAILQGLVLRDLGLAAEPTAAGAAAQLRRDAPGGRLSEPA